MRRGLHAPHDLVNERDIEMAHRHGLRVGSWTVNGEDEARYLVNVGVDDVTGNYPDGILRAVEVGKVMR